MHLTLSDPKDMKSPRHVTAFGRAAEDLKKGELLFDEDTKTLTYREINDEEKKAQRADQALADMNRAEDASRLALLQASRPGERCVGKESVSKCRSRGSATL